jgi:hypothetical protein
MRLRRCRGAAFGLAAALLLSPMSVSELRASALLEASLGYGGYYVPGKWAPLRIRCDEAPSGARIELRKLGVEGAEAAYESFPVPRGGVIECPLLLGAGQSSVGLRLVSSGRTLAEIEIDGRPRAFPGNIVLALGASAQTRMAIASALSPREPVLAVSVSRFEFPTNGLDLDGVRAIVADETEGGALRRSNVELSPSQEAAMKFWMAGGGRLLALTAAGSESRLLAELGLGAGGGRSATAYGLGAYSRANAEGGRSADAAFMRSSLGLEPYEPRAVMGAGSTIGGADALREDEVASPESRVVALVAVGVWLLAMLVFARVGRKRPGLLAGATAVSLLVVVAGAGVLAGAFGRGSQARIRILAMPGAESALASISARAYEAPAAIDWANAKGMRGPELAISNTESGSFGAWEHGRAAAEFSPRKSGTKELGLVGVLRSEAWRSIAPAAAIDDAVASAASGGLPPHIDSSRPLAFLGEAGEWWTKAAGATWTRGKSAPDWLGSDSEWIRSIAGEEEDASILFGLCDASPVGFRVQGKLVTKAVWAMPLPRGAAR